MDTDELTVELRDGPDRVTLKVRGDLDLLTVGRLRAALADVSATKPLDVVTVDLTEARFSGALTVGLFARSAIQLQRNGRQFHLCGLTPFGERLVRVCGFSSDGLVREGTVGVGLTHIDTDETHGDMRRARRSRRLADPGAKVASAVVRAQAAKARQVLRGMPVADGRASRHSVHICVHLRTQRKG